MCNMTCFARREIVKRLQLQGLTLFDNESTKYLGVHIDKKLSFKTHIEEIKSKLKKRSIVSTNTKIDSEGIL